MHQEINTTVREDLATLLKGGFAPIIILLREFDYKKISIVLDGLPYSVWSLLGHVQYRQELLLNFMKNSDNHTDLWPEPYWPENEAPVNKSSWDSAIDKFENDLEEIINIVKDERVPLLEEKSNGKSIYWAALAVLQHNAYHLGQVKAIGRQLGVW